MISGGLRGVKEWDRAFRNDRMIIEVLLQPAIWRRNSARLNTVT